MANWYGAARTNYVKVNDLEGLKAYVEDIFGNKVVEGKPGMYGLFPSDMSDDGGFVTMTTDDNGDDVEWEDDTIMSFVAEGEVLIFMSAGYEKLRYIDGYATALRRRGDKVDLLQISLDDIYRKAAEQFGVDRASITSATY